MRIRFLGLGAEIGVGFLDLGASVGVDGIMDRLSNCCLYIFS